MKNKLLDNFILVKSKIMINIKNILWLLKLITKCTILIVICMAFCKLCAIEKYTKDTSDNMQFIVNQFNKAEIKYNKE